MPKPSRLAEGHIDRPPQPEVPEFELTEYTCATCGAVSERRWPQDHKPGCDSPDWRES